MVTLISFNISLLDVLTKYKVNGALKLDLYGLFYFRNFNIRISRKENAKWKKEQFTRKRKNFCSIDLKFYNHLNAYKTQLHTQFGRILNSSSGILGVFSSILHHREMFLPHGSLRLLWKTSYNWEIRTSYPICSKFFVVTYLSVTKIPSKFIPV